MSTLNPGTSINFDGHVLEKQAEAELEKEDQRCQEELRELLTTALPDDLLDDDGSSSLSSSLSPDQTTSPEPWQVPRQQQLQKWSNNLEGLHSKILQQQTSTPHVAHFDLPPLKTPASYQECDNFTGCENPNKVYTTADIHSTEQDEFYLDKGTALELHKSNHDMAGYDRGEVEGADSDEEFNHMQENNQANFNNDIGITDCQQETRSNDYYSDGVGCNKNGDYEQHYGETQDQIQSGTKEYLPLQNDTQHYGPSREVNQPDIDQTKQHQTLPTTQNKFEEMHGYAIKQTPDYQTASRVPRSVPFRVQYRGDGAVDIQRNRTVQWRKDAEILDDVGIVPIKHRHDVQCNDAANMQFLETAKYQESEQFAQLQILYKAKSRELERVTSLLDRLKEENAREKRILNHQLSLANGERDGAKASSDQIRALLLTCREEKLQLDEQLLAKCDQVQVLTVSKDELMERLHSAECTIENLAQQLQAMKMTGANSKFSREQDNLLTSIQDKHQQEMNTMREKLDKANKSVTEKDSELEKVQEELKLLRKTMDDTRIEHCEVVNKLSRSLDESQSQCRIYLKSGCTDEVSQLKHQLKLTSASCDLSQDMCKSLQEEVQDLKEQLQMYESAVNLGVLSSKLSPKTSESFVHLGVRNLDKGDWETPKIHRLEQQTSQNQDVVLKLRTELERVLCNNQAKRNQVNQLQEQLKTAKGEYEKQKQMAEEAQYHAKDLEVRMQMMQSKSGRRMDKRRASFSCVLEESSNFLSSYSHRRSSIGVLEARRNTSELESLKHDCEALKQKLEKRGQENLNLKQQMAQMVNEHDDATQKALQRTQDTCIQLHEDSSKQLREHMVSEWETERDMLKEAHQHHFQEIRTELETAQAELCEVKEMYLAVCEEKKQIEDEVTKKLTADAEKQLTKATAELNASKDKATEDIKKTLENKYRVRLLNAKAEWQKEANQQTKNELELKLAEALIEWNGTVRKQAVESTRQAVETEWQTKLDLEVEKKLAEQLDQAKKDLKKNHQEYMTEQIRKIKAALVEKHKTTLDVMLNKAELEWKGKSEESIKEKVQEAVKKCHKQWLAGDTRTRGLVDQVISDERAKWLKESVDWEEVKKRWMKEEGTLMIQQEVLHIKEELKRKHAKEIKDLRTKWEQLDSDRRKSMKEAKEKLEKEHDAFLLEHNDTLTNALQTARAEYEKDKAELVQHKSLEFQHRMEEKERKWQTERKELLGKHKETDLRSDDTCNDGLSELRSHYLATVHKIRGDVLKYVTDMREQCRHTVHTEVTRERNATAKKLRQYYLQCLHQLMDEDKLKSNRDTSISKFVAKAQALELAEDRSAKDASNILGTQGSTSSADVIENYNLTCGNSVRETEFEPIIEPNITQDKFEGNNMDRWHKRNQNSDDGSKCVASLKSATTSKRSNHSREPMLQTNEKLTVECSLERDICIQSNSSLSWPETSERDTLSSLPRQPREFNPSPERLMATSQTHCDAMNLSCIRNRSNNALVNVTVRSQNRSLSKSEYLTNQECKENNPTVNEILKPIKTANII